VYKIPVTFKILLW